MEVVGRVREIGADRDGRLAVANPPIGPHDGRERRNRGHRIVQRVLLAAEAENRRSHAQGIHRRGLGERRFAKDFNGSAGERSPCGQIPREPDALGRFGQAAMQEQVRQLLEAGARSQIFDGVSGDGQPARLAIDLAEPSRCGHDVFQTLSHASMFEEPVRLVNIDWINQLYARPAPTTSRQRRPRTRSA